MLWFAASYLLPGAIPNPASLVTMGGKWVVKYSTREATEFALGIVAPAFNVAFSPATAGAALTSPWSLALFPLRAVLASPAGVTVAFMGAFTRLMLTQMAIEDAKANAAKAQSDKDTSKKINDEAKLAEKNSSAGVVSANGKGTLVWRLMTIFTRPIFAALPQLRAALTAGLDSVRGVVKSIPAQYQVVACKATANVVLTAYDLMYVVPTVRVLSALGRNLLWIPGTGILTGLAVGSSRVLWLGKAVREKKFTAWVLWTVVGSYCAMHATNYEITAGCTRVGALLSNLPVEAPDSIIEDVEEEITETKRDAKRIMSATSSLFGMDTFLNPFKGLEKANKLKNAFIEFKENREELGDSSEFDHLGPWGPYYNTVEIQTHVASMVPRALLRSCGFWDKHVAEFLLFVGFDASVVERAVLAPTRAPKAHLKKIQAKKIDAPAMTHADLEIGGDGLQVDRVLSELGLIGVEVATEGRLNSVVCGVAARTVWSVASGLLAQRAIDAMEASEEKKKRLV